MGGTISFDNKPGGGSCFHLELPFALPTAQTSQAAIQPLSKLSPTSAPCTVLIADDNLLNLKTTELILQKLGHRFVIVSNGKQAVEKWQQGSIDLILMDIQMPEMGGVEALKIIRSEELCVRHTPVVALTADALKGTEDQLLAAGFDDYLSKPVKVHVLQEAICRLIHPETVLTARP